MRGKVSTAKVFSFGFGITPAYAGKSFRSRFHDRSCGDHPRLCGEKECWFCSGVMTLGSPPPMRGKVVFSNRQTGHRRITPAYAGKRQQIRKCDLEKRDHPRLCGEKTKKIPKQRYFFHQPASFSFSLQYT